MEIKTKFEVGQEAYTIINGVEKVKIEAIEIFIVKEIHIEYIVYANGRIIRFFESHLYKTAGEAEEVLNGYFKNK